MRQPKPDRFTATFGSRFFITTIFFSKLALSVRYAIEVEM
jgi:hypothetical protein